MRLPQLPEPQQQQEGSQQEEQMTPELPAEGGAAVAPAGRPPAAAPAGRRASLASVAASARTVGSWTELCAICLSPPANADTTACGHTFCRHCLLRLKRLAEEANTAPKCPECRSTLPRLRSAGSAAVRHYSARLAAADRHSSMRAAGSPRANRGDDDGTQFRSLTGLDQIYDRNGRLRQPALTAAGSPRDLGATGYTPRTPRSPHSPRTRVVSPLAVSPRPQTQSSPTDNAQRIRSLLEEVQEHRRGAEERGEQRRQANRAGAPPPQQALYARGADVHDMPIPTRLSEPPAGEDSAGHYNFIVRTKVHLRRDPLVDAAGFASNCTWTIDLVPDDINFARPPQMRWVSTDNGRHRNLLRRRAVPERLSFVPEVASCIARVEYTDVSGGEAHAWKRQMAEKPPFECKWVSRHDIFGIWVAFFQRCQRYRCDRCTGDHPV
eukprot:COSAG04_NODE_4264_length_2199_cov_1.375714_2_plen_438_part_00